MNSGFLCVWLAVAALVIFCYPATSQAAEIRKDEHVEIHTDETVDDTLVALAQTVEIAGHVHGDVVAFARSVTVTGTVDGDLITAAEHVEIAGTVRGSVMTAGQDVNVAGVLGSQLYAAGQAVTLDHDLELSGDAMLAGSKILVAGAVGRDVYASGEQIEVDAVTKRDLVIGGVDLQVGGGAVVGRNLRAQVDDADALVVDGGASVLGATTVEVGAIDDGNRFDDVSFYVGKAVMLAAGLVFGIVVFSFAPKLFEAPREQSEQVGWPRVLGIGLVSLIVIPLAAIIVAFTLIGLPLAAAAIGGYVLALYLGKLFVAAEIGRRILRLQGHKRSQVAWSLLLGLAVVMLVVELPYVGWFFSLVVAALGLGSVIKYLLDRQRARGSSQAAG